MSRPARLRTHSAVSTALALHSDHALRELVDAAAAIFTRHAPIAAAMSAFTRAFEQASRSTPYPDEEIRHLLGGQGSVLAQPM